MLSHKYDCIPICSQYTPCMAAPGSPCGENMGDSSKWHSSQDLKPKEIRSEEAKLEFSEDEEMLIARMFNLVGQRWSLIAGRIPGRTAEEIEKYWSSRQLRNQT